MPMCLHRIVLSSGRKGEKGDFFNQSIIQPVENISIYPPQDCIISSKLIPNSLSNYLTGFLKARTSLTLQFHLKSEKQFRFKISLPGTTSLTHTSLHEISQLNQFNSTVNYQTISNYLINFVFLLLSLCVVKLKQEDQ